MPWNWEQTDWPNFAWGPEAVAAAEQQFLLRSGLVLGSAKHLNESDRDHLKIELMSTEALTTSEIEGEMLDRASLQSSIRKQLGLTTDSRTVPPAEQGIAELMVSAYRTFEDPVTDELLFAWHRMVLSGHRDIEGIGAYRTGNHPMQVVSHAFTTPKVHFEAPPSSSIPAEMAAFNAWFNRTAPTGSAPLPALTRAGIAHLYFVSIHPFIDGNGRIGRAISEKALAQSVGQPTLTVLAATILAKRKRYYQELEAASHTNEITKWLIWFAETTLDAQERTVHTVEFLLRKTHLLNRLKGQLNYRQEKALLRMFREGPSGFRGGLSAANYMTITEATPSTTTRDLADLVAKGTLARVGEHRYARYFINLQDTATGE